MEEIIIQFNKENSRGEARIPRNTES